MEAKVAFANLVGNRATERIQPFMGFPLTVLVPMLIVLNAGIVALVSLPKELPFKYPIISSVA